MNKKWLVAIVILALICAVAAGVVLKQNADRTRQTASSVRTDPTEEPAATAEPLPAQESADAPYGSPEPLIVPDEELGQYVDDESELAGVVVGEEFVIELGDEYAAAGG